MKLGTEKITMFSLLRANAKTAKHTYLKYWHKAVNWQIWEQIFKRIYDCGRFPEQKYGKLSILYSQGKVILAKRMINHEFSGPSCYRNDSKKWTGFWVGAFWKRVFNVTSLS